MNLIRFKSKCKSCKHIHVNFYGQPCQVYYWHGTLDSTLGIVEKLKQCECINLVPTDNLEFLEMKYETTRSQR